MPSRLIGLLSLAVVLMAGCGAAVEDVAATSGSRTQPDDAPAAESSSVASTEAAVEWPQTQEEPPAGSCLYSYPEDLDERPYAFDGTVVSVSKGDHVEDAGGTPVELEVEVNETFNGSLSDTVTLNTWNFAEAGSGDIVDPTGARILAATGDTMDLMGCGFTRPYSADDAALWRTTFSG